MVYYIFQDKSGKEIGRKVRGPGRPRNDATLNAKDGNWYVKPGVPLPAPIVVDEVSGVEVKPEKKIVYYVFTDAAGVEVARVARGRGRPRTDCTVGTDGNLYPPRGVLPITGSNEDGATVHTSVMNSPKEQVYYIFTDLQGNETAREHKGRGRTRHDATLREDGNWYVKPGVTVDSAGHIYHSDTLLLIEELKPTTIEDVKAGWTLIAFPAGKCPVKLNGTDANSVYNWRESLRKHYAIKNEVLSTQAMEYFINHLRYDRKWIEERDIALYNLRQINLGLFSADDVALAA